MEVKDWRSCKEPNEIMHWFEYDKKSDKFDIIKYFSEIKNDTEIIEKLLDSKYYTPEEIANRSSKFYSHFTNDNIKNMLINYANTAWQKLNNPEKILFYRTGPVSSPSEDLFNKLKYFYSHDIDLYYKLKKTMLDYKQLINFHRREVLKRMSKDEDLTSDFIRSIFEEHLQWVDHLDELSKDSLAYQEATQIKKEKDARIRELEARKAEYEKEHPIIKDWKKCSEPDEIMKWLEYDADSDKYYVIKYFGQIKSDSEMIKKLLDSPYYTPEEIAKSKIYSSWWDSDIKHLLIDYANKSWQKLDRAEEIIHSHTYPISLSSEEIYDKIQYFHTHNLNLYKDIINLLPKYKVDLRINVRIIFDKLIEDENVDIIRDMLKIYPKYAEHVSSYDKYRELYYEIIDKTKIDWQKQTSHELVMYHATEENKWEILEYFAQNNEKMFSNITRYYTFAKSSNKMTIYTIDEVLDRYKDADLDKLPNSLKKYILDLRQRVMSKKEKKELPTTKKRELLLDFRDENGDYLRLFKIASITPTTKEEYLKVLEKFLEQPLGVDGFCSKYKIDNTNGFKKMLEIFSSNDKKYESLIREKFNKSREQYLSIARDFITGVCEKGEPISKLIRNAHKIDFEKFILLAKSIYPDKNYDEILAKKIINYYYARLFSYNQSMEPENIAKMLTNKEIAFIVGEEQFKAMLNGEDCSLHKEFLKRISFLRTIDREFLDQKATRNVLKEITKYNYKFKRNKYFKYQIFISLENGEEMEVTPEIVDMAYKFAKSKSLYTSDTVMRYIINAVANGKIKNREETISDKREMMNKAFSLIQEITNIDEYFKTIDNLHQKK